jgi:hypothetical protein
MLEETPYEILNSRKPNIAYFLVFDCKCYILKKDTRLSKFEKEYDEGFLLGYTTTSKAYRVWNLASGTLEEVRDVEFDETNGSQEEDENLDDVRGTQLANAMKKMDIGDIRPREVIEVEMTKIKCYLTQMCNPLDSIIGDISRVVQTRSRLVSFYEHFSFVSFIEPKKIDEALKDVD